MSDKDLDKKLAPLEAQLTTKQLIITVDEDGTPSCEASDFTDWEVVGLANWLLHEAEAMFDRDDEEPDEE